MLRQHCPTLQISWAIWGGLRGLGCDKPGVSVPSKLACPGVAVEAPRASRNRSRGKRARDLFAATLFKLAEAPMDERSAQPGCFGAVPRCAGGGPGPSQVPVGRACLLRLGGVCALYSPMVPASRRSCPAPCMLAGRGGRICFWHGGIAKGMDRLYRIAHLFISYF